MPIRSGLGTQFGLKAETVYGTPVTVDRFMYIESEKLVAEVGKIESPVLGALTLRTSAVSTYASGAGGDVTQPVMTKGMGVLLDQAFGVSVSAQIGATAEYTHTFTPDTTNGLVGKSATLQVLKPNTKGALVNPFTFEGSKCAAWTLEMPDKGLLALTTTWVCETLNLTTALAAASYPTNLAMFNWSTATVTLGGTAVFLKSFSVTGEWAFDTERRGLSQSLRKEPIPNASPGLAISGKMAGEFEDLTLFNAFLAGTQQELVFTVTTGTIPTTANPYKLTVTLPAVELTGDTPTVGGPGILEMPATFRALDNGVAPIITLVTNSDEAAL